MYIYMIEQEEKQKKDILEDNVHALLAHSYVSYLVSFLFGLLFHFIFPIKIYTEESIVSYIGLIFLFIATILIVWAQKTSRHLDVENLSKESFTHGPYCYTRMPTHWGLFFLMIGFGLVINSFFTVLFTCFSFILSKFAFLKKEEEILLKKYGQHYLEYKKLVKF